MIDITQFYIGVIVGGALMVIGELFGVSRMTRGIMLTLCSVGGIILTLFT